MKRATLISIVIIAVVLAVGLWLILRPQVSQAPTTNTTNQNSSSETNSDINTDQLEQTLDFSTLDLADRDPKLNFAAQVPAGWVAEYIPSAKAINFYQPSDTGTTLEDSVIYVTYYENNSVVQPTTDYQVESGPIITLPDFPTTAMYVTLKTGQQVVTDQPTWLASRHLVADVQWTSTNPKLFYRFAKVPTLADSVFTNFLESLTTDTSEDVDIAE